MRTRLAPWLLALLAVPLAATAPARGQDPGTIEAGAELNARLAIVRRCAAELQAARRGDEGPGLSAALVLPGDATVTVVAGPTSAGEDGRPIRPEDRMLSGSIGKTYVAAAVLHLVAAGKLALDERAAGHFQSDDWFARVPNGADVTLRQLLRHTSGIPRYVFARGFWEDLLADRDRVWKPEETLAYVFDAEPGFAAGDGWAYADTNYIILGMIVERVSGTSFYEYVRRHLLDPHDLDDTIPSDRREIPGLIQGRSELFAGFGIPEQVIDGEGRFVINPQFEWCGGGFASTPRDLARWAGLLWSGHAFEGDYLEPMLDAVSSPQLGPGARYGLGVMLRDTAAGRMLGHDGVMPGYFSTMGWFPDAKIAGAIQMNTDAREGATMPLHDLLARLVEIAAEALSPES